MQISEEDMVTIIKDLANTRAALREAQKAVEVLSEQRDIFCAAYLNAQEALRKIQIGGNAHGNQS